MSLVRPYSAINIYAIDSMVCSICFVSVIFESILFCCCCISLVDDDNAHFFLYQNLGAEAVLRIANNNNDYDENINNGNGTVAKTSTMLSILHDLGKWAVNIWKMTMDENGRERPRER